jgi:hypothetical protein
MIETYALSILRKDPQLKQVVGIAMEPPRKPGEARGGSEDLIYAEQPKAWGEAQLAQLAERQEFYGIMKEGTLKTYRRRVEEYPQPPPPRRFRFAPTQNPGPNRKRRRAMKARARHK